MSVLQRLRSSGAIGREAVLTTGTRLTIMVAGLATAILTARVLGPQGRGLYFYAITVAGLVAQFGNLGFPSSNTYFVARQPELLRPLAANSLWLTLLVLGVSGLAALAFVGTNLAASPVLLLAVLLGAANLFLMLYSNLLVGVQRIATFNLLQLGANLAVVPAIFVAALLSGRPEAILAGSLMVILIFCVLTFVILLRGQRFDFRFDKKIFVLSLGYSFRIFLVTLIGFAIARANVFVIGAVADHAEVGFYSVAVQIGDVLSILPVSVALVVFPRLVRQQEGRYRSMMRLTLLIAGLEALACAAAALVAEPFVRLAFGADYLPALPSVYATLPGSLFLAVTSIVSQYMAASGQPKRTFLPWLLAAVVLVGAALLLVPTHKALGAAAALSIAYAVLMVAMLAAASSLDRKHRRQAGIPLSPEHDGP